MTTITKERLLTIKQWRETYGPGSNVVLPAEEAEELARIALASLEAEPVAWTDEEELRDVRKYGFGEIFQCPPDKYADPRRVISLYRELPAPVVPDDWQLVPKKITLEMECALSKADSYEIGWLWALAAAPKYEVQNAKRVQNALNACRAAMLQSGNFREIAETSTNYPAIPSEVLSAILKVARIRADFDDFDGDRRGIGDCLDEAEQELIVTINKYASQLAAEPIATNDVREQQTAVPPVPEIQDDVAQAIENLKQKLVECNRYNYCADAVKGVEDACHAAMLQGRERLVLDAATRTAAGGEMMDVKEKVLQVMRSRAALQDKALGGEYPFRMATWNLRLAMEKEFPDEEWRSADLRKILMELAKDGTVSKDTHASRIGQAVWRLEVR